MRMVAQQGSLQHCSKTNLEDEGMNPGKKIDENTYYHKTLMDGDFPREGFR